jgi:hypothetical protein
VVGVSPLATAVLSCVAQPGSFLLCDRHAFPGGIVLFLVEAEGRDLGLQPPRLLARVASLAPGLL